MTTAVGAAHRLPSAAHLRVARRNSLRSLRELRSDNRRESDVRSALRAPTPRLRCSAPPTSPRRDPVCPARGLPAPEPDLPPKTAHATSMVLGAHTGPLPTNVARLPTVFTSATTVSANRGRRAHGRGRCRPGARLVRSREAQPHRRCAQRASSIILAAIVRAQRAKRAERVSPRQPVRGASQGTPAKRGQAPGAPLADSAPARGRFACAFARANLPRAASSSAAECRR